MTKLQQVKRTETTFQYLFYCPGCKTHHAVNIVKLYCGDPVWQWNGSMTAPTFSPSVLVRTEKDGKQEVCHSFIREGKIKYLDDCTHELAGKTIEMEDVE